MNYLIISATILVIIGIIGLIAWFISFRTKTIRADYKILKETKEKLEKTIEEEKETLRQLNEQQKVVLGKTISAQQEYTIATQKAAEAKARADSQLAYGLEQTRAELQHLRELEMQKLDNELQDKTRTCKSQYEFKQKQFEDDFNALSEYYQEELGAIKEELGEYAAKRAAINEAIRREEELQNEIDTHRIILSETAKEDIHYLISIEPNIHNKDLLHKLIWSEYLQVPFNNMLKRIFGSKIPKNVIYCIENIKLHKKYIGKTSAEVSKRWTEHIKSSLNIGGIKRQNIHEALFEHWDEFTFSIMEEVLDSRLSEREKYYINFFETDKFGYNQKGGG